MHQRTSQTPVLLRSAVNHVEFSLPDTGVLVIRCVSQHKQQHYVRVLYYQDDLIYYSCLLSHILAHFESLQSHCYLLLSVFGSLVGTLKI